MTKKRRKLKSAVIVGATEVGVAKIDLRDVHLPYGAEAAIIVVDDPLAIRRFAAPSPAERVRADRNGSVLPESIGAEDIRAEIPKREVLVSLRSNPLQVMRLRKHITPLQQMAGLKYRDDIDASMIGGASAIDYSRPAVDGGKIGDPLRDSVSAALERLARADRALMRSRDIGHNGVALCRAVLGEGLTVADFGRRVGAGHKYGLKRMGDLLRSCLDILAEVYGLATRRAA